MRALTSNYASDYGLRKATSNFVKKKVLRDSMQDRYESSCPELQCRESRKDSNCSGMYVM